jgi:hypothetical protein
MSIVLTTEIFSGKEEERKESARTLHKDNSLDEMSVHQVAKA